MLKNTIFFTLSLCFILGLTSCKTTKKEGELSWLGKQYQDVTSRFNGYYNADVILNESIASLEGQYVDNYNQLLPIYPSISIENPEAQAQELDRAIKKVAVVSNLHPGSKWIDDCYVMMGKAQYLKQDYESAEETLKYFQDNFNPLDPDSRVFNASKKEDPNEARKRNAKEQRKIREIERKKEEQQRKEDNKLKEALKKTQDKVKEKIRNIKEDKREFTEKRKKELNDIRKKHREIKDKNKDNYDKELKRMKDQLAKKKKELSEVKRKESESERERKIKEREAEAKRGGRFERRRKSDIEAEKQAQEIQKQQAAQTVTKSEQLQREVDQQESALEAFQEQYTKQRDSQSAADTKELEEFNNQSDKLEEEYVKQEEDILSQEDNRKKAEQKEKEEAEAAALENPFDEQLAEDEEPEKKDDKIKSRDNIGKAGFLKHRPAYVEGQYWLAMTYIERQNFHLADYILNTLEENPSIPKEIAKRIPASKAHLYLKQNRDDLAPSMLKEAMDVADRRQDRARYAFILAQLLEKRGQYAEASEAFLSAKDKSPVYDMKFNAELANLRTSWLAGSSSMDESQRKLNRLTRDIKNYDYLDQIYFTKAELFLANGDEEEALEAYTEATRYGQSSPERKAESYFRLANLFYSTDDYINAKVYFDSTLQVMPEKDDRYKETERLNKNLTSIASNATIVEEQDSLLRLANLSEEELEAWAINRYESQQADPNPNQGSTLIQKPNTRRPTFNSQGGDSFFAYNKVVLDKGKFDFNRKWGDRPLQDNWRRSSELSQTQLLVDDPEVEVPDENEIAQQEAITKMLRDIPVTPVQQKIAVAKLQTALFDLGTDLRNNLDNYTKSNEVLSEYINRYPNSEKLLDVYYYLYLNNVDLGDQNGADRYLSLIQSKFPESDFAKSLSDPTYAEKIETDQKKLDDYYTETYQIFEAGNYEKAVERAAQSSQIFGTTNNYSTKFDLLTVMSKGALDGKEFYISELKTFIQKHPNTPETTRASEILRFLRGNENAFDGELYEEELANFTRQDEKLHYIIYVLYDCDLDKMKKSKQAVADYNSKFHKMARLRISNIFLNPENQSQVILIRSFENREKALEYMAIAKRNVKNHLKPEDVSYDIFAVTQNNYREVMKQKTTKNYEAFYDIHYVQ